MANAIVSPFVALMCFFTVPLSISIILPHIIVSLYDPDMIQPDPTRPCNHLPRRIRSSFTGRARFPCLSATLCFRLSDRNGSPIPLPLSQLPAGKPSDPLSFMNLRRFIVRSAFMGFPDVGSLSGASPQTKGQIHPTIRHAGSVIER